MIPGRCIKCRRRSMSQYSAHCSRRAPLYDDHGASDPRRAFLGMLLVASACFLLGLAVLIVRG